MTLYVQRKQKKGNWIVEADLKKFDINDIVFFDEKTNKTSEMKTRENARWKELVKKSADAGTELYDGELICIREIKVKGNKLHIGISKSSYKEHHASCPVNGITDEYTKKFFPYAFEVDKNMIKQKIPNFEKLFPSFAAATLIETNDKKICYVMRSDKVDTYKKMPGFNSGGKFNGQPHKMVDELIKDSSSIFKHITEMLQREYSNLDKTKIIEHKLTGIARSLDDLDITLCVWTKISLSYEELKARLNKDNKYSGIGFVPATKEGIKTLLKMPFPSITYPVIVQAAYIYGVNPEEVNKSTEKID